MVNEAVVKEVVLGLLCDEDEDDECKVLLIFRLGE